MADEIARARAVAGALAGDGALDRAARVGVEQPGERRRRGVDLDVLIPPAPLPDIAERRGDALRVDIAQIVEAMRGGRDAIARAVGHGERGGAKIALAVGRADALDPRPALGRQIDVDLVEHAQPHRHPGYRFQLGADRLAAFGGGGRGRDDHHKLAGARVEPHRGRAGQRRADRALMIGHRPDHPVARRLRAGAEHDRHGHAADGQALLGDGRVTGQVDEDAQRGAMLDRYPRQPVAIDVADPVGRCDALRQRDEAAFGLGLRRRRTGGHIRRRLESALRRRSGWAAGAARLAR